MVHCFWFSFFILLLNGWNGLCDDEKYIAGFTAGAESCNSFENKIFKCDDMYLAPMYNDDEDGAGSMCIQGSMELHTDVDEDMMINVDIQKETDAGSEPMFTVAMNMCESLKKEDAPWIPLFKSMGIEKCPVAKGTYSVNNMTLDLKFCEDVMNHNYVGEYTCEVTMRDDKRNILSCHTLGLYISEQ